MVDFKGGDRFDYSCKDAIKDFLLYWFTKRQSLFQTEDLLLKKGNWVSTKLPISAKLQDGFKSDLHSLDKDYNCWLRRFILSRGSKNGTQIGKGLSRWHPKRNTRSNAKYDSWPLKTLPVTSVDIKSWIKEGFKHERREIGKIGERRGSSRKDWSHGWGYFSDVSHIIIPTQAKGIAHALVSVLYLSKRRVLLCRMINFCLSPHPTMIWWKNTPQWWLYWNAHCWWPVGTIGRVVDGGLIWQGQHCNRIEERITSIGKPRRPERRRLN